MLSHVSLVNSFVAVRNACTADVKHGQTCLTATLQGYQMLALCMSETSLVDLGWPLKQV